MTLWAAIVAEQLGHAHETALTLGRAVAGLNAQSKAVHIGLREPATEAQRAERRAKAPPDSVSLLGRAVPVVSTPAGVRAAKDGKADSPQAVERYLASRFGDSLEPARAAMVALARSFPPQELAERAYSLYERFRPEVPAGQRGWGAKGVLDLARLASLAPGAAAAPRRRTAAVSAPAKKRATRSATARRPAR
jgi:hypothetical protein